MTSFKMTHAKNIEKPGRALAYSPDGTVLALGQRDGIFMILDAATLDVVKEFHHRKQNISDIKFDPFGRYVAVGSHENCVDLYSIQKEKRIGICRGPSR